MVTLVSLEMSAALQAGSNSNLDPDFSHLLKSVYEGWLHKQGVILSWCSQPAASLSHSLHTQQKYGI